jgi:hypothetical protein
MIVIAVDMAVTIGAVTGSVVLSAQSRSHLVCRRTIPALHRTA